MTVSNGEWSRYFRGCCPHSFLCIEPGYYADGRFGIRIENVVVVRNADTPNNFGDKGFLKFEHVTLVCLMQGEYTWRGHTFYKLLPVPYSEEACGRCLA